MENIPENRKESLKDEILKRKDVLFECGMCRHTDSWWNKMNPIWTGSRGHYMDGGHWSVGTGFVITAIFDRNPDEAIKILSDCAEGLEKFDKPEWISRDHTAFGGRQFMMGIAMPLLAIEGILNGKMLAYNF